MPAIGEGGVFGAGALGPNEVRYHSAVLLATDQALVEAGVGEADCGDTGGGFVLFAQGFFLRL